MARKGVPLSDAHRAALKQAAARRRAVPEVTGTAAGRTPLTNVDDWPEPSEELLYNPKEAEVEMETLRRLIAARPAPLPEPPYHDKGGGRRVYKLPPGDLYLECFAATKLAVLSRVGAGAVLRLSEAQQDALRLALGHWRG